ncbi:MAG: hypothetical protein MJZ90_03225 [Bacteroidales bacterium]|nr:hypothetical protein [archaeon]MCQ2317919.1 hypothetical protein [Bacteroidales bacterium]
MKTLIRTIIILAILAGIMYITIPTEENHRTMVEKKLTERIKKENPNSLEALGKKIMMKLTMSQFEIDDYVVLNIGHITHNGETQYISIGMFNHVFLIDRLDL